MWKSAGVGGTGVTWGSCREFCRSPPPPLSWSVDHSRLRPLTLSQIVFVFENRFSKQTLPPESSVLGHSPSSLFRLCRIIRTKLGQKGKERVPKLCDSEMRQLLHDHLQQNGCSSHEDTKPDLHNQSQIQQPMSSPPLQPASSPIPNQRQTKIPTGQSSDAILSHFSCTVK